MKVLLLLTSLVTALCVFAQPAPPHSHDNIATQERKAFTKRLGGGIGNGGAALSMASGNFNVDYYRCNWNINPAVRYISGSVTSYFTINQLSGQITYDFDNTLTVDSVSFRGTSISFTQTPNRTLEINFGVNVNAGDRDSVTVFYKGVPPNTGMGSFTTAKHGANIPVMWTLSEPYGARDWWPCKDGLNDKADSVDIYITHPAAYTASGNGLLVSATTTGGNTTTYFKHRYAIASYLVGIAVTNYTRFSQTLALQSGTMPVVNTVYPEYLGYFQALVPKVYGALQLYDEYFGDYPFKNEQYGQTEFDWGGGMEHQTNSFITNADEYLMAHELAHQWFGDKVTCGSWHDIWLNEGFATYLADIFYAEKLSPDRWAVNVGYDLSDATAEPHGSVYVEDTTDINRLFSNNLTYKKGSMMLRMLRWTLGDTAFFNGLKMYQQDAALAYGFARTADLQRNLEAASGTNLTYFFNQWFYGKGYPSFKVEWGYNGGTVNATLSQTTSDASVAFYKVPLQLVLKNATQEDTITVDFTANNQALSLPVGFVPDTVLIDPVQYLVSKNNQSIKGGIFPVTLLNFTGTVQHETALLQWKVVQEINMSHYEVERSADGNTFTSVGSVAAAGTAAYAFTDINPIAGLSYYRLKVVNADGSFFYSSTITLTVSISGFVTLTPNPVGRNQPLSIRNHTLATVTVYLYTVDGKLLKTVIIGGGGNKDVYHLPSGSVVYKAVAASGKTVSGVQVVQ